MDKIFLIGHRGVGKTKCLKNFQNKNPNYHCVDLDEQVEKNHHIPVASYFEKGLVSQFRENESRALEKLCQTDQPLAVALGAGFELEKFNFPIGSVVLWLRRQSDPAGRVFSQERPALTTFVDPLEEWASLFLEREKKYAKFSNAQVCIPEGDFSSSYGLHEYLFEKTKVPENYFCTLKVKENAIPCMSGTFGLELRNDLMSEIEIHHTLKQIQPLRPVILAVRQLNDLTINFLENLDRKKFPHLQIDWDIALGPWPQKVPGPQAKDIFSEHRPHIDDLKGLHKHFQRFCLYKFSPTVENLEEGFSWLENFKQDFCPDVFLPRSQSEDLTWFRKCIAQKNAFNFFKFSEGSAPGQAYWFDLDFWNPKGFYGILGEDVKHSYTPSFHRQFFREKKNSPLNLSLNEEDLSEKLFSYLKQWQIKALAVTSPYKTKVHQILSRSTEAPKSINTVSFFGQDIHWEDTDTKALQLFLKEHIDTSQPVVVWGGGSLRASLQDLLPEAYFLSARSGQLLNDGKNEYEFLENEKVQVLWAAGEKGLWPRFDFKTHKLVDLDYKENSKAKRWAVMESKKKQFPIEYISGERFFILQAKEQQKIWTDL